MVLKGTLKFAGGFLLLWKYKDIDYDNKHDYYNNIETRDHDIEETLPLRQYLDTKREGMASTYKNLARRSKRFLAQGCIVG